MKIKHLLATLALASLPIFTFAEAPAGYYSSLNGLSEGELKTAIYNLVRSFTQISSYSALPSYFQKTDLYPDSHRWWDMYSDIPLYAPSFSGLNREHSFPKSWWGGSTSVSAYVDLNHLYPSEMRANTAKSNYPLGEVAQATFDNGVVKVGYPVNGQGGSARLVFEPNEEYLGDFARTYFYMVTCYQNLTWKYTYMMSQNDYPTLKPWAIDLLMKWHHADPVSQKEIDRNEAVFQIQNNRNPFIDLPELADYLWGSKKGEKFTPGTIIVEPVGDPELIAPVKDMELQFNQVALGQTATAQLLVKGKNLQGSVLASIWSGDNAMFTANVTSIPASQACTDEGYWLKIDYKPTAVGEHSSKILLQGSFPGSRTVRLSGECKPVPVLGACTANAPTDIMNDRYTANWSAPDGDVIDYFVVTRTRYVGGQAFTEELVAENNYLEILGFDGSDSEAYSVQSEYLGVRSPMSNVVFVEHAGVTGVDAGHPLAIKVADGYVRFICSAPQTGCRVYDMSGRLLREIGTIENNMEIELPAGVYLIVTDAHRRPLKAAIR